MHYAVLMLKGDPNVVRVLSLLGLLLGSVRPVVRKCKRNAVAFNKNKEASACLVRVSRLSDH